MSQPDLAQLRREYTFAGLRRADLNEDPIAMASAWLEQALAAGIDSHNAMTLATADEYAKPSARVVLLKSIDASGLKFFTNYNSAKAQEMEANGQVSASFFWPQLERQIRIEGMVSKLERAESEAYFASRPHGSQAAAAISAQSQVVASREVLEQAKAALEAEYPQSNIPCPEHWGGYLLKPDFFEFWQGRENRLHDRFAYSVTLKGWQIDRLAP